MDPDRVNGLSFVLLRPLSPLFCALGRRFAVRPAGVRDLASYVSTHGRRRRGVNALHDGRRALARRLRPVPDPRASLLRPGLGRGGVRDHAALLRGASRGGGLGDIRSGAGPHQQRRLRRDAHRVHRRRPHRGQIWQEVHKNLNLHCFSGVPVCRITLSSSPCV